MCSLRKQEEERSGSERGKEKEEEERIQRNKVRKGEEEEVGRGSRLVDDSICCVLTY